MKLPKANCHSCPQKYDFMDAVPKVQSGVMMCLGDHFCLGKKKARRLKKFGPRAALPSWCPKYLSPRKLLIYGFKDTESWLLHEQLCHSLSKELPPDAHRYAVEFSGTTELTAEKFLEQSKDVPDHMLLGREVSLHSVIEIDDGVAPACFYKTTVGYQYVPLFDVERARQNVRQQKEAA